MDKVRLNKYITLSAQMEDGSKMPVAHFGMYAETEKDVYNQIKKAVTVLNLFGKELIVDVEDV
jgi:hypothetical protein